MLNVPSQVTRIDGALIVCSRRGKCDDDGRCVCRPGYHGTTCELDDAAEQYLALVMIYLPPGWGFTLPLPTVLCPWPLGVQTCCIKQHIPLLH